MLPPAIRFTEAKIMGIDELKIIRGRIKERVHSWSAGLTSVSELTPDERKKRIGLAITEEEKIMTSAKMADEDVLAAQNGIVFVYPSQWDWRSLSRNNWTTPVKDQGDCGSCVAFATVGTIESNLKISRKDPLRDPDLSEADLFFRGCGNCSGSGWNFAHALIYARNSGIPDEACYPYNGDGPCPDRDKRAIKIDNWRVIYSISQAKEWISKNGPLMTGMEVCDDFFYYTGGVYVYESGDVVGNHTICVVGYDEVQKCWICKNSWGTSWGDDGWFKIAYGECGIGSEFPFYTTEFNSNNNDLIMPKNGRVLVRLKSKGTAFDDRISLHYPADKPLFVASSINIGQVYDAGTFVAGTRLDFALTTHDNNTYYTDSSLNKDACNHIQKTQLGTYKWEIRWEDMYGLAEQDFNDVVMEVEVTDKTSDDISMPKDGKVIATFKSKGTNNINRFMFSNTNALLFVAEDSNLGKTFDVGTFSAGTKLGFALEASDRHTYYTDSVLNPDSITHVKVLPTGSNKWELRWEDSFGLVENDYSDLVVEIEVVPSVNSDIVMPIYGRVSARFVSKGTPLNNEFRLFSPVDQMIFMATNDNLGKTFDLGTFSAGTRLAFALKTPPPQNDTYYTNSTLNPDGKSHVFKMQLGPDKCQLRWEDIYNLADGDYNDVIVEISIKPN